MYFQMFKRWSNVFSNVQAIKKHAFSEFTALKRKLKHRHVIHLRKAERALFPAP